MTQLAKNRKKKEKNRRKKSLQQGWDNHLPHPFLWLLTASSQKWLAWRKQGTRDPIIQKGEWGERRHPYTLGLATGKGGRAMNPALGLSSPCTTHSNTDSELRILAAPPPLCERGDMEGGVTEAFLPGGLCWIALQLLSSVQERLGLITV